MRNSHQKSIGNFITGFLVHIHPRTLPKETLRFSLSLGLGGMAATLLGILFFTGLLQLFTYAPDSKNAYVSIQQMYTHTSLGGWIRNIHYWAGNLLVIVTCAHLFRVFLTGAVRGERRLNWLIGLSLLFLVLFANFSGYLLPWDQLAYWAVTIFTGMLAYIPLIGPWLMQLLRGGTDVGAASLSNFYAIHIALIPAALCIFNIWHFWLVRKASGLVRTDSTDGSVADRVPSVPDLVKREAGVGLTLVAFLLFFSSLVDAPLADPANPAMSPNPAKAAWYFLGLQELLLHLSPSIAICVVPLLVVIILASLPFWRDAILPGGIWFGSRNGWKLGLYAFISGGVFTVAAVLFDDMLLRGTQKNGPVADLLMRGILPLTAYILAILTALSLLARRTGRSRSETVMAGMLFHLAVLICLTATGIWFRGAGMRLVWPWG